MAKEYFTLKNIKLKWKIHGLLKTIYETYIIISSFSLLLLLFYIYWLRFYAQKRSERYIIINFFI